MKSDALFLFGSADATGARSKKHILTVLNFVKCLGKSLLRGGLDNSSVKRFVRVDRSNIHVRLVDSTLKGLLDCQNGSLRSVKQASASCTWRRENLCFRPGRFSAVSSVGISVCG